MPKRLGKNSLHTRLISIYREKTEIKKDNYPQMSQMNADEQKESPISLFLAYLRSSATSADTLSFSLLFLAKPQNAFHPTENLTRGYGIGAWPERRPGVGMPKRIPPYKQSSACVFAEEDRGENHVA